MIIILFIITIPISLSIHIYIYIYTYKHVSLYKMATQHIVLTARGTNFRSFLRSVFPYGLSLDFEHLLLIV